MPYPHHPQPPKPILPAMPASALIQNFPATRASKNLQIASFALATGGGGTDNWICVVYFMIGLTFYAVLIYDFGTDREHCFMPVRRWFDEQSSGFFTLSEGDRKYVGQSSSVKPSTKTPVEFFRATEGSNKST